MKKRIGIAVVLLAAAMALALAGCSTSKSYTFNVSTGDSITVEMDTTGDYSMSEEEGAALVEDDDETVVKIEFDTQDNAQSNIDTLQSRGFAPQEVEANGQTYTVFYAEDDDWETRAVAITQVEGSNTYLLLTSYEDEDDFTEVLDRLTYSCEE